MYICNVLHIYIVIHNVLHFYNIYIYNVYIYIVNAAGFGAGRCRYSALVVAYGIEGHPFARSIKELFVLWCKLLSIFIYAKKTFSLCN